MEVQLDRLGAMMRARGITSDRSLAEKAGIDNVTVSRLRRGERPHVSAVTLGRIAVALGVSLDYLMGLSAYDLSHVKSMPSLGEELLGVVEQLSYSARESLLAKAEQMLKDQRQAEWINAKAADIATMIMASLPKEEADAAVKQLMAAVQAGDIKALELLADRLKAKTEG